MAVLAPHPVLFFPDNPLPHFIAGGICLALYEHPGIDFVAQDTPYTACRPGCNSLFPKAALIILAVHALVLHRRGYPEPVELIRNPGRAHALNLPFINLADDGCRLIVHYQLILIVGRLLVSVGGERADVLPAFPLHIQVTADFHGNIPAVCVIYEIFERNQHFIRCAHFLCRVYIVVDGNETHTQIGKNFLNITPRLNVVPTESGQILHNDAVHPAGFDVLQHFLKCRAFEADPRISIIHFFFVNLNLRMCFKELPDESLLIYNAVALHFVAVFF